MNLLKALVRTAPLVHPHPGLRDAVSRVKYCARGLAFSRHTSEWFRLLRTPKLAMIARAHPHILSKLQRPYLNRSLGTSRRLEILKQHYGFVAARFADSLMKEVYGPHGLLLASIPLGDIGHLELRLGYSRYGKEGDLTLSLQNRHSGAVLFALTFCFSRFEPDHREIFIGGLQGC